MKHFLIIPICILSQLYIGCSNGNREDSISLAELGSLEQCTKYIGTPHNWLKEKYAGMSYIPTGSITLGSPQAHLDEYNFNPKPIHVNGFWMDQTEVTVAQFQSFIEDTNYITDAERKNEAVVFSPLHNSTKSWWQIQSGYTWKTPNGATGKTPLPSEPVRYITKNDAEQYAAWLGRELPSEIEWEYAAKAGIEENTNLEEQQTDHHHPPKSNYWQGDFPYQNLKLDGFEGIAPVGCFPSNSFHLYDMVGNVWEWTNTPYQGPHNSHNLYKRKPLLYVIKGGSYLCAINYCARYRNSSRHPQEFDLPTSHIGFRTILRTSTH